MNRSKDKGTWAETAVAYYLQCNGWPSAERRTLRGNKDRGDITGTPGICWEVKYAGKSIHMREWMSELREEMFNCDVDTGVLAIKPPGYGDKRTSEWYAVFPATVHAALWFAVLARHGAVIGRHPQIGPLKAQSATAMAAVRLAPWPMAHVMTYSPGWKAVEHTHYCTMLLQDAVVLLRLAGYGDEMPVTLTVPLGVNL